MTERGQRSGIDGIESIRGNVMPKITERGGKVETRLIYPVRFLTDRDKSLIPFAAVFFSLPTVPGLLNYTPMVIVGNGVDNADVYLLEKDKTQLVSTYRKGDAPPRLLIAQYPDFNFWLEQLPSITCHPFPKRREETLISHDVFLSSHARARNHRFRVSSESTPDGKMKVVVDLIAKKTSRVVTLGKIGASWTSSELNQKLAFPRKSKKEGQEEEF